MPQSFMNLRFANLAGEAQVAIAFLRGQLGHRGNPLPAAIADTNAVFFHTDSIARAGSAGTPVIQLPQRRDKVAGIFRPIKEQLWQLGYSKWMGLST